MRNKQVRFIVWLGALSITGIIVIQGYFLQKTLNIREKQYTQTLFIALKNVADRMSRLNQTLLQSNPVRQLSSNYFVVDVNSIIDANILEFYLKTEFERLNIRTDYEYAIYDCHTDKMVYGNYISSGDSKRLITPTTNLPKYSEYLYYFGIHFPTMKSTIAGNMALWFFLTGILLISVFFFAYAIFVILQQKRLSELQKDFINNMTHEFKTPIASINISADVITGQDIIHEPERLSRYGKVIKQENQRLNLLVEKVLQVARIEKGHPGLKIEMTDINLLIETVTEKFRSGASVPFTLKVDLDKSPVKIPADMLHTTNILMNLLENAVKYSGAEAVVEVTSRKEPERLIIAIRDYGPGIPHKFRKKVFDQFFRIPTGDVHDVKGFGLGLYYVRQICRAQGWKIRLESTPGQGSAFFIEVPLNNPAKKWIKKRDYST